MGTYRILFTLLSIVLLNSCQTTTVASINTRFDQSPNGFIGSLKPTEKKHLLRYSEGTKATGEYGFHLIAILKDQKDLTGKNSIIARSEQSFIGSGKNISHLTKTYLSKINNQQTRPNLPPFLEITAEIMPNGEILDIDAFFPLMKKLQGKDISIQSKEIREAMARDFSVLPLAQVGSGDIVPGLDPFVQNMTSSAEKFEGLIAFTKATAISKEILKEISELPYEEKKNIAYQKFVSALSKIIDESELLSKIPNSLESLKKGIQINKIHRSGTIIEFIEFVAGLSELVQMEMVTRVLGKTVYDGRDSIVLDHSMYVFANTNDIHIPDTLLEALGSNRFDFPLWKISGEARGHSVIDLATAIVLSRYIKSSMELEMDTSLSMPANMFNNKNIKSKHFVFKTYLIAENTIE